MNQDVDTPDSLDPEGTSSFNPPNGAPPIHGSRLSAKASAAAEGAFLRSLAGGDFQTQALTSGDYERMASLVEQYADLPLGTTDAAVIAVAERLQCREVATLDRRHFTVVRPTHANALTLLP